MPALRLATAPKPTPNHRESPSRQPSRSSATAIGYHRASNQYLPKTVGGAALKAARKTGAGEVRSIPEPACARALRVFGTPPAVRMKMRKEDKAALVDEIADRLGDADAIFAVDYRGITVPQAAELRAKLAEADASFRVVKNRLARRATERAGKAELEELLVGPTALTFVKGDAVTAAKAISTFGRQHDILDYKGGLMDGAPLDPEQFKAIARLPGVDVLRSQLLGAVASPLTGLTRGLASMLSGLAVALGQVAEQGLVGGESEEPAAADEAPDTEANEAVGEGTEEEPAPEAQEQAAEEPSGEAERAETDNDDGSEEKGSDEVEAEGETSEEEDK